MFYKSFKKAKLAELYQDFSYLAGFISALHDLRVLKTCLLEYPLQRGFSGADKIVPSPHYLREHYPALPDITWPDFPAVPSTITRKDENRSRKLQTETEFTLNDFRSLWSRGPKLDKIYEEDFGGPTGTNVELSSNMKNHYIVHVTTSHSKCLIERWLVTIINYHKRLENV